MELETYERDFNILINDFKEIQEMGNISYALNDMGKLSQCLESSYLFSSIQFRRVHVLNSEVLYSYRLMCVIVRHARAYFLLIYDIKNVAIHQKRS